MMNRAIGMLFRAVLCETVNIGGSMKVRVEVTNNEVVTTVSRNHGHSWKKMLFFSSLSLDG